MAWRHEGISVAGWRMAFVLSGAFGLLWTAAWLLLFRDPREARWLSEPERQMILAERSAGGTDGRGLSIAELMGYRTMWGLFIAQGCINYTQYLALTWLPSYLVHSRGLDLLHSGIDLAMIYIGACLLTLLFGQLSDAVLPHEAAAGGARRYGVVAFCALASVMLAVPFVQSIFVLVVVLTLALTGMQSALTNNYSLVSDVVRDGGGIGRAVSWLQLSGNVFGIFAPIGTGYLLEATGSFTSAFLLAGGLLLLGAVVSLTMTRRPVGDAWHAVAFEAAPST
jgi:cyanate permease